MPTNVKNPRGRPLGFLDRWLVIGITSPENWKVGSFWGNSVSCFLIETKFIFKIFKKFRRENESQEIPHLRFFIISSYYHIIKSKNQKEQTQEEKTKFIQTIKINLEVIYTGLPKILRVSDSQIFKIHISKDVSICSCIFKVNWQ